MKRTLKSKTPLLAAFFVSALCVSACRQSGSINVMPASACEIDHTTISAIQGEGGTSPMLDEELLTGGVVTLLIPSVGLYIEDASADDSEFTSNGLFVNSPGLSTDVSVGDQLLVSGRVAELGENSNTISALTKINGIRVCASHQVLPETRVALPLNPDQREALEGMLLSFNQELVISNAYNAAEGLQTVNLGGIMPAPTELARPGADARALAAKNRLTSLNIERVKDYKEILPVGTRLAALKGVLGHDGQGLRLIQVEALRVIVTNPAPIAPPLEGEIRVVGLNLLNYFNGNGKGGGFPTPRGAKTIDEFSKQRQRLSATIAYTSPHLVAVMELENDGFDEFSAAYNFIEDLEKATGKDWSAISIDGPVGGDVISVGLFYQPERLAPSGHARILTTPEFQRLSRVPMAQQFQDKSSGESFLVVVNHLKSKGSCPADGRNANLKDGQGCWNLARTQAAKKMVQWTLSLADASTQGKALILGDMNAYRMEDPITAIIEAGFKDLKATSDIGFEFSYIHFGAAGTLDYAFASVQLRPFVQSSRILHINSTYPQGVDLPQPWLRSSDHDPVVVDLRFRQSATSD